MKIHCKKGLDLPLKGAPQGTVQKAGSPTSVALDLSPFNRIQFKLLVKEGDTVQLGQPLVYDKKCEERVFVSPASGIVHQVVRGEKRRLLSVCITPSGKDEVVEHAAPNLQTAQREELVSFLLRAGFFPFLRQRPCDVLADPQKTPKSIFINAATSSPFAPPSELLIRGHETDFQLGIQTLKKLTDGKVHLVYRDGCSLQAITQAENVEKHTVSGPHPSGNTSLHIEKIDPITNGHDVIWTIHVQDVLRLGQLIHRGVFCPTQVVAIAGEAAPEEKRTFYETTLGVSYKDLAGEQPASSRLISGDVLTGTQTDHLGFYDTAFTVIPEKDDRREILHFFRIGGKKYTASKAYLSGFFKSTPFSFTTNLHGEERAFVDGTIYDKYMPLNVSTMHLVKAILAEDFEAAEELGLLEVAPEDFALATFACPSKIEMVEIVSNGLQSYYENYLQ